MRFSDFEHLLSFRAKQTPDAAALKFSCGGTVQTLSFAGLHAAVLQRAEELRSSGKTCIGILSDGSKDCVITIFAAAAAGLQVVMLDENVSDALLRQLIRHTDIDTLWGSDGEQVAALSSALTGGVSDGKGRFLFFTSGTTEAAKAVVLTEQSLCSSAWNGGEKLPLSPEDTLLCLLPLCHVFGFVCGLLWGLSCGASVALGRGARHYADDCAYFEPTAVSVVPLLLGFFLKQDLFNSRLRLVLVGAGDCPRPLLAAAAAKGIRVSFGYGLTETSSGVAISVSGDPFAMEVCPDDRITLAEDGEILIESPTCMMQGYYKRPADTEAVLKGGVLYTGDLGRFDEEGKLHIIGRKKDILVLPDGTKIFLPEYESKLFALLGTAELAVVLKDSRPALVITGESTEESAIWAKLKGFHAELPRGQQIGSILFIDHPLPRTATGKLKRWEVQREAEQ